jgi:hypothetical protein
MTVSRKLGPIGVNPDFGLSAHPGPISTHTLIDHPGPISTNAVNDRHIRSSLASAKLCDHYRDLICESYQQNTPAEIEIVSIDIEGYEYLFDLAHDRVVGVFGYSYVSQEARDKKYMAGFLGRVRSERQLRKMTQSQREASEKSFQKRYEEKYGTKYDRGHFISLRQGGVYDINLFPQRADINRDPRGLWRKYERICVENPGSFCYVRPFYDDDTWVPFQLEYGIVSHGHKMSEKFPNRV